jgi:hypothetical protein
MSIHQYMPVQVVPAVQGMLFCPDCSQKMRIVMAIPTHDGRERRTYECAYGHRTSIDVSLTSSPTISPTVYQFTKYDITSENLAVWGIGRRRH